MADYIKLLYKKGEKERAQETLNVCMYLYREDPILPQVENAVRKPLNAGLLKLTLKP